MKSLYKKGLSLLLILSLSIVVAAPTEENSLPRSHATLSYVGEYKTVDSYGVYKTEFNLSIEFLYAYFSDGLYYNLTYELRGVRTHGNTTQNITYSGFSSSSGEEIKASVSVEGLPSLDVAFSYLLPDYLSFYSVGLYDVRFNAFIEDGKLNFTRIYEDEEYYRSFSRQIDLTTLVVSGYYEVENSSEATTTFRYRLTSLSSVSPYTIEEQDYRLGYTRSIGSEEGFTSISIETSKLYSVGPMKLLASHVRGISESGALVEYNSVTGYSSGSPIEGFLFFPFILEVPAEGLVSTYKSPFLGEMSSKYFVYTLSFLPLQRGSEVPMYLGVNEEGALTAGTAAFDLMALLSDTPGVLAKISLSAQANTVSLNVTSYNATSIVVYLDGEVVANQTLTGSDIINVPISDPLTPHYGEVVVTNGEHGVYRYFSNAFNSAPSIEASAHSLGSSIELNVKLSDRTVTDAIEISIGGTLINASLVTNQEASIILNASRAEDITIVARNPITGAESTKTVSLENQKPTLQVAYDVSKCNVTFELSIGDPDDDSFTMYVYVDGELKLTKSIGSHYTFRLEIESGTHEVRISIVDSAGNEAVRTDTITTECGESGGESGGEGGQGLSIPISFLILLVVVLGVIVGGIIVKLKH